MLKKFRKSDLLSAIKHQRREDIGKGSNCKDNTLQGNEKKKTCEFVLCHVDSPKLKATKANIMRFKL